MKNADLIGVYLGTDQAFDNGPDRRCIIGQIRLLDGSRKTVKGYANEGEISDGVTYRFFGHNRTHPKFGVQFNFNSFVAEDPVDEESVIAYLETCRKPERGSITRRVALALFEAFGIEAIERLKADPIGASERVRQWDAAKATLAAQYLTGQTGTQRSKLALITMLNGRGFPKKTIDRAIKEWGAAAADIVRKNPYALMDLPGIGFKGADKLYCDLAREAAKSDEEYQEALAAIHRQGLCAAYAVQCESRSSGSTWIPMGFAKGAVVRSVGGVRATPDKAIDWAVMEGQLTVRDGHVAVSRMALHELEIAEFITSSDDGQDWPAFTMISLMAPDGKPLSDHQMGAIETALVGRVCCLQGSPGVGKTFAVACIVKALIERFGRDSIAVCAPTGKAGVRVQQSMAANGVDLPATTIHRLLQVEGEGSGGWSFHYNDQNPLPYRFIVADECFVKGTMVDAYCQKLKIEDIKPGQKIWNANGIDTVVATLRKKASHVAKIYVGKKTIVCSPNHKFFTERGFVVASELEPGDSILRTSEAVRLLWNDDISNSKESCTEAFLRGELLREMANSVSGVHAEVHTGTSQGCWRGEKEVFEFRNSRSKEANREDSKPESNEQRIVEKGMFSISEANGPQAEDSRRERASANGTSSETISDSREGMDCRASSQRMGANQRVSDVLQNGHSKPSQENCDRDRRPFTRNDNSESQGQEERPVLDGQRVERVEIYESTSPELDQWRDADGNVYLYDLQIERHRSYSVNGLLVHNCSMIDVDLMASLLRACTSSTHILMVGDIHQLAPVGHGRPFYDLQKCVPVGRLTEIRRNSGRIVEGCAEIRDHHTLKFSPKLDIESGENLPLVHAVGDDRTQAMENLLNALESKTSDLIEDVQILTGKNDYRKQLNTMLQKFLNPDGASIPGNPFRRGDKIVCLKNGKYQDPADQMEEHFVANGELGRVLDIKPGRMVVRLCDPVRSILITHAPVQTNEKEVADSEDMQRGAVGDWDLGYCLSVHRSQGSQWKFVIVMLESGHSMIQTRNWTYTAISRAEIATFVVGTNDAAQRSLRVDGISGRKTFLTERIQSARLASTINHDLLFAEV